MTRGRVKWFDSRKGWGFVVDNDGREWFVHHKEIDAPGFKALKAGREVEFEPAENEKGTYAANVRPLNPP